MSDSVDRLVKAHRDLGESESSIDVQVDDLGLFSRQLLEGGPDPFGLLAATGGLVWLGLGRVGQRQEMTAQLAIDFP